MTSGSLCHPERSEGSIIKYAGSLGSDVCSTLIFLLFSKACLFYKCRNGARFFYSEWAAVVPISQARLPLGTRLRYRYFSWLWFLMVAKYREFLPAIINISINYPIF